MYLTNSECYQRKNVKYLIKAYKYTYYIVIPILL